MEWMFVWESQLLWAWLVRDACTQNHPPNGFSEYSLRENSAGIKQQFLCRYHISRALNVQINQSIYCFQETEKQEAYPQLPFRILQTFIRDLSFKGTWAFRKGSYIYHLYHIYKWYPSLEPREKEELRILEIPLEIIPALIKRKTWIPVLGRHSCLE